MDRPLPWLRYVDADQVDASDERRTVTFDGLKVRTDRGDTLGHVDGFVVDRDTGRPYYVVVDAGGWFKSKEFLLPVGHASVDDDRDALVADVPKERIHRFPGFDKEVFTRLGESEIQTFNDETCVACGATSMSFAADESYVAGWDRPDYAYPDWWRADPLLPDRMGERAVTSGVDYSSAPSATTGIPSRDRDLSSREMTVAHTADPSPHYEGRAQPGDVLGVETGGERTALGETAEDENQRRSTAERTAAKQEE